MRMRNQQFLRLLERSHSLRVRHRGEVIQKVAQGMAAFDVVDQSLQRNASPNEDRRSTEDLGIDMDNIIGVIHVATHSSEERHSSIASFGNEPFKSSHGFAITEVPAVNET